MRRGDVLERERRQQRKADHHAERHDGERAEIARAPAASAAAAASSAAPSSAAITARAEVRNSGVKPPTATRVAGSEPLKMITLEEAAAPSLRRPAPPSKRAHAGAGIGAFYLVAVAHPTHRNAALGEHHRPALMNVLASAATSGATPAIRCISARATPPCEATNRSRLDRLQPRRQPLRQHRRSSRRSAARNSICRAARAAARDGIAGLDLGPGQPLPIAEGQLLQVVAQRVAAAAAGPSRRARAPSSRACAISGEATKACAASSRSISAPSELAQRAADRARLLAALGVERRCPAGPAAALRGCSRSRRGG